ncbi:MAG: GMC oxidoreductase, partial [Pseudomonadota bacterium]
SRGKIEITSRDPEQHPKILFNYNQHPDDVEAFRNSLRITREIMLQPAMDRFRGREIQPGEAVQSDDELDAWIRQHAESAYHPSCTCKIGADEDAHAVLDPECRVRGTTGLRVVDSSVFPTITNGNLNAPTIMVAEKAADIILDKDPLPASNAPYYVAPEWQTTQREGQPLRDIALL